MTPSEEFVARLCRKTFLSLWSTANPRGKESGKELCDILIVCDPDVIIVSVKDIRYKPTPDVKIGMDRWTSRAIEESEKQIFGAERLLAKLDRVTTREGSPWLYLPPLESRRVHRVAVALGSKGQIPIAEGRSATPFVHVLDEGAVTTLLGELDTISDFVDYLRRSEEFLQKTQVVVAGAEDLLAYYIQNGRRYPEAPDLLMILGGWDELVTREEFKRRKAADSESYLWDTLIELIAQGHDPSLTQSHGESDDPNPAVERVARIMAREDRFARRLLAKSFREFHQGHLARARMVKSPSGVIYVLLATPRTYSRDARREELLTRCFIARGMHKTSKVVVGIATEEYDAGAGSSFDTAAYIKEEWTPEDQAEMERVQRETGAFVNPSWSASQEDEYPKS